MATTDILIWLTVILAGDGYLMSYHVWISNKKLQSLRYMTQPITFHAVASYCIIMPYVQSWTTRQPIETNTRTLDLPQADCILSPDQNLERSEIAVMADVKVCTPNPSCRNKDTQTDDSVINAVCIYTLSTGDIHDLEAQSFTRDGVISVDEDELPGTTMSH
jgi:hypothetical protein